MSQTSLVFSLLFLGLASPATAFDIQAHRGGCRPASSPPLPFSVQRITRKTDLPVIIAGGG
ncbi:hypothetical protein, partial [Bradyrhizobium sp.]|uniref:hypothetical protein n=1 Tax=Bradyrhizobium sp. TaxID=376 RepID=UPI00391C2389